MDQNDKSLKAVLQPFKFPDPATLKLNAGDLIRL